MELKENERRMVNTKEIKIVGNFISINFPPYENGKTFNGSRLPRKYKY